MTYDLPPSLADAWRPLGTRTGETSVALASITAETTVYEPLEGADRLAALGASRIPARSLFVVDVSVSPSLSTLGMSPDALFEKAAPKAKSQFVDTLEDEGIVVDDTRERLEFEATNGSEGAWYVLDAAYPVADGTADGDGEGDGDGDGTEYIPAEAHAAVWPTETSYGLAGGVLPLSLEGVADDADADPESAAADGGELDAALDIDPERDRETIAELIRTIDLTGEGDDAE